MNAITLSALERRDGSWWALARRGDDVVAISGGFTSADDAITAPNGFSCPEAALLDVLARAAGATGFRCDSCAAQRTAAERLKDA